MAKTSFNYAALTDAKVRKAAQDAATDIRAMLQVTGQHVVAIGTRLIAMKETLGPKVFGTWLKAEFEWTESVATNHMLCARRFSGLDCLHQFQPFALYQLCRQATPDGAIKDAIKLARSGELVTGRKANDLIAAHGGKSIKPPKGEDQKRGRKPQPRDVDGLRSTLETFAASLNKLSDALSREDRDALADRFLQLALQLRSVSTPQTGKPANAKAPRRSRSKSAAV